MKRNLDGIYFRVKDGDKYDNVCFSDLTEEQMKDVIKDRSVEWLQSLAIQLGKTIKNIGDEFDIVCQ